MSPGTPRNHCQTHYATPRSRLHTRALCHSTNQSDHSIRLPAPLPRCVTPEIQGVSPITSKTPNLPRVAVAVCVASHNSKFQTRVAWRRVAGLASGFHRRVAETLRHLGRRAQTRTAISHCVAHHQICVPRRQLRSRLLQLAGLPHAHNHSASSPDRSICLPTVVCALRVTRGTRRHTATASHKNRVAA